LILNTHGVHVTEANTLAIIVGGGPAPGINGVISAVTIRATQLGLKVLGIRDGYKHLVQRRTDKVVELDQDKVYRIHLRGGSMLGTSRENPTKSPELIQAVVETLQKLGIKYLVSIGGDDTALSARYVTEHSGGTIQTAHVPKTIDNDLPLPAHIPTFGYNTARDVGARMVQNLMTDAQTTRRWYFVVAMGRKAGHLALGIGKSAGATNTLITEEFPEGNLKFSELCDHVEATILKRMAQGRPYGVVVLAEGLIGQLDPSELQDLEDVEVDDHGHVRFAEVDLGRKMKDEIHDRLRDRDIPITIVSKNIGYELRCARPIPLDMEYTRDLGHAAVEFLVAGGSGAMVTIQGGKLVPMRFEDIRDPETEKTSVRLVDIESEGFEVAKRYMFRLTEDDLNNDTTLASLARVSGLPAQDFQRRFASIAAASLSSNKVREGER
jgi:6-phosphofructokinase 1